MGKTVICTTILVFLLVAVVSDAAIFRNFRQLAALSPNEDPTKPGSPVPSPVSPAGGEAKGKEKKKNLIGPPPATIAEEGKDKTAPVTPPVDDASEGVVKDKEKEEEEKGKEKEKEKEKGERKPVVPVGVDESCDEIGRICHDEKSMTACVKSFDYGSKALVLIQNKGDSSLKVDLIVLPSGSKVNVINIPKLQNKKVDVSLLGGKVNEITLDAGNGHCVLHLGSPVSQRNFFQLIPSYSKFMTPIYGAYLMIVITLIAGGVFTCCWFRKRKGQRDIPYQELEMSVPESAVAAETAEGWDEVWDDDWDEENAVRSPGGHSISANGLTSRNSKKDDWEDWDD